MSDSTRGSEDEPKLYKNNTLILAITKIFTEIIEDNEKEQGAIIGYGKSFLFRSVIKFII